VIYLCAVFDNDPELTGQGGIILRPYEAIIVFNGALSDDKIEASIAKFEKKIKESGGSDIATEKWGTKKLSFKMKRSKKATEGAYVMIKFNGEGATPNELKNTLRVTEDVIRFSVISASPAKSEPKEEKVEIEPSMLSSQGDQPQ
jgi:small subunit ribosomal protein S6